MNRLIDSSWISCITLSINSPEEGWFFFTSLPGSTLIQFLPKSIFLNTVNVIRYICNYILYIHISYKTFQYHPLHTNLNTDIHKAIHNLVLTLFLTYHISSLNKPRSSVFHWFSVCFHLSYCLGKSIGLNLGRSRVLPRLASYCSVVS